MNSVSNRNPVAEAFFRQNDALAKTYPRNLSKMNEKYILPNPMFPTKKMYFYDSVVQNAHSFPNVKYIKPYDPVDTPINSFKFVNESIEKNKKVFYGGMYHPVQKYNLYY